MPEYGITGTPVIDPASNTLYVVSFTQEGSAYVQRLHALDLASGAENFGGPVKISASVSGSGNGSSGGILRFDPKWENQHPALLLLKGVVYIGYAAHGDNGPWHGWILSYQASTLAQIGAYCASPNGFGSGIWMSGAGLAAEVNDPAGHPYGRMFVANGNGDFNAAPPYTTEMDFGVRSYGRPSKRHGYVHDNRMVGSKLGRWRHRLRARGPAAESARPEPSSAGAVGQKRTHISHQSRPNGRLLPEFEQHCSTNRGSAQRDLEYAGVLE